VDELVLVGDFGAGTSDFTLMRLGPSVRGKADRREDVLASSGVRIGGDRFDAAIVEHRLMEQFGAGSTYLAFTNRMPLPTWLTRKLLAWHELSMLRERSNLEFLRKAATTSDAPEAVENLIRLAEENMAYHLYRAVEAAKRELSARERATVQFLDGGFEIEAKVSRREFETWTAPLRAEFDEAVDRVLRDAGGVTPDAVFLTGGTSKIPPVRAQFAERFGEARLREGDAFTSVVAGLGRAATL
ncbi:MAG: Hsp70 family protein, partial [Myxococcales bacterium]